MGTPPVPGCAGGGVEGNEGVRGGNSCGEDGGAGGKASWKEKG